MQWRYKLHTLKRRYLVVPFMISLLAVGAVFLPYRPTEATPSVAASIQVTVSVAPGQKLASDFRGSGGSDEPDPVGINARISVKNISDVEIIEPLILGSSGAAKVNKVAVWKWYRIAVPLTPLGQGILEGRGRTSETFTSVLPGQTLDQYVRLDMLNQITEPGEYRVQVSHEDPQHLGRWVKSNVATFDVAQ